MMFYQFLAIFSKLPRIDPPVGFGRPNPSSWASVPPPRMLLKWGLSFFTHSRPHFRPSLNISLNPPPPKHLPIFYFPSSTSITPLKSSRLLQISKPPFFTWNPNCLTPFGWPWHQGHVQNERGRSLFTKIYLHTLIFLAILLLKFLRGIQLELLS